MTVDVGKYAAPVGSTRRRTWRKDAAAVAYFRRQAARRPGRRVEYTARAQTLEAAMDEAVVCRRCGAPLKDPASVARRIGPDCYAAKLREAGG